MGDILKDDDLDMMMSQSSSDLDIGLSIDEERTPDDLNTPDALNNSAFEGELDWGSTGKYKFVLPCILSKPNVQRRYFGFVGTICIMFKHIIIELRTFYLKLTKDYTRLYKVIQFTMYTICLLWKLTN